MDLYPHSSGYPPKNQLDGYAYARHNDISIFIDTIIGDQMPKYALLIAVLLMLAGILSAQYIVGFEGAGETKLAYASGDVTLSGILWNMTEDLIGDLAADWKNGAEIDWQNLTPM